MREVEVDVQNHARGRSRCTKLGERRSRRTRFQKSNKKMRLFFKLIFILKNNILVPFHFKCAIFKYLKSNARVVTSLT